MQSAKQKSAKTSPKNKQNLIKRSPKTSNPQVLKKNRKSPKKQAQIRGKTAVWKLWSQAAGNIAVHREKTNK